nr:hypothetical protein [Streptomyces sp. SID5785]
MGRGGPPGGRGVPALPGLVGPRRGRLPGAGDLAAALLVSGRTAGLPAGEGTSQCADESVRRRG